MQINTNLIKKKKLFLAWGISLVLLVRAVGASSCELQGHEAPSVPWVVVALKAWSTFPFGCWACTCLCACGFYWQFSVAFLMSVVCL